MTKRKFWDAHVSWDEAEKKWDAGAEQATATKALKGLKSLPKMPGITPKTAKNLKWKSLKYMVSHDKEGMIRKNYLKHPFRYGKAFLKSIVQKQSYKVDGDFFLYGVDSVDEFQSLLADPESLLVVGFSYCHKPFECPAGRFTDDCYHDPENPICRQCFIGKTINTLPDDNVEVLIIPTVHYIGEKIFDIVHAHPDKRVLFMITACEMTLKMFGDWGNMVNIKGIGIKLGGRICNTMKAFELSEEGIKPGLTVVMEDTQKKMLDLIRFRRNHKS